MIFIVDKIAKIEKEFKIEGKLFSKTRKGEVVRVRGCIWHYLRHEKKMKWSEIGRLFSKDHASVIFISKKVSNALENPMYDPLIPETYNLIKNIFENE